MRRLVRLVRRESGYSVIELITVMVILTTVLGGLTTAFVQATNAELHSNNRFRAQIDAGVALDRLRRDVHCARSITPTGAAATITLTQPTGCPGGGGSISWCALGSGTRYALYRQAGTACTTSGVRYADYVTSATPFGYAAPVAATSLATLHVDLPVNVNPSRPLDDFRLVDDIVLRNSVRA